MTLLERTKGLLAEALQAGVNARQIAETSAGAVNHEWLKKFIAGKIDDPGVSKIQSLHNHLGALAKKRGRAA